MTLNNRTRSAAMVCIAVAALSGCSREPKKLEFEPNMVFAHALEISGESDIPMRPVLEQTQAILEDYFGTPEDPKLPDFITSDEEEYGDYLELVSLENLKLACGVPDANGEGGLYRRLLCVSCHGTTGNGRGEAAATLVAYPRDYRMGVFKFKSTDGSAKPLREDLTRIIRNGIPDVAMNPLTKSTEAEIEALTDYVIYLSWRGQLERMILYESPDLFAQPEEGETAEEKEERLAERKEWIQDLCIEIADEWLYAEDDIFEVPERPEDFPVPDTIEEVVAAAEGEDSPLKQSIEKGREIFATEQASCTKCHGKQGHGDGQGKYFDDWTNDWTVKMGFDPLDYDSLVPLIARGALPPRYIDPRDFRDGTFRGGSTPEDIYHRISRGIAGTPMPKAKLEEEEIWHLVNFVRSLRVKAPETADAEDSSPAAGDAAEASEAEAGEAE